MTFTSISGIFTPTKNSVYKKAVSQEFIVMEKLVMMKNIIFLMYDCSMNPLIVIIQKVNTSLIFYFLKFEISKFLSRNVHEVIYEEKDTFISFNVCHCPDVYRLHLLP